MFRVSEIMDNIRHFMARGVTDKTLEHLNEVVRTACEFTDAMAKEAGITTAVHFDAQDDRVTVSGCQFCIM